MLAVQYDTVLIYKKGQANSGEALGIWQVDNNRNAKTPDTVFLLFLTSATAGFTMWSQLLVYMSNHAYKTFPMGTVDSWPNVTAATMQT